MLWVSLSLLASVQLRLLMATAVVLYRSHNTCPQVQYDRHRRVIIHALKYSMIDIEESCPQVQYDRHRTVIHAPKYSMIDIEQSYMPPSTV